MPLGVRIRPDLVHLTLDVIDVLVFARRVQSAYRRLIFMLRLPIPGASYQCSSARRIVPSHWVVFEPNMEPTWIAVRQSVTNFLRTVCRNGALMGATEDGAFFVRCDRTTMTQDDLDNGRLICLIGVAPVRPANFVIFRISQKTREAE